MCSSISVRLSIFHQPEDNAFFLESTIAKRTQLFVSVKLYDKTTIKSRHTLHHLKDKQRHHVKYSLWNKIYGHDLKVRLKHGVSFRSLWFFLSKWFSNIFVKINCSVSIFYCMLFSVDILLYVVQCRYSTVCIVSTCSIIIISLLRLCLCPNEWASEHEQYSFNAIEHLFNYIMAWTIYVLMKWWWWWRSKCVFYYTKHAQFTHF
jgi:hypothetical protein